jgi:hypothetical protein
MKKALSHVSGSTQGGTLDGDKMTVWYECILTGLCHIVLRMIHQKYILLLFMIVMRMMNMYDVLWLCSYLVLKFVFWILVAPAAGWSLYLSKSVRLMKILCHLVNAFG